MKRMPLGSAVVLALLAVLALGSAAQARVNTLSCHGWNFDIIWTPISDAHYGPLYRINEFHGETSSGPVLQTLIVTPQYKDSHGHYYDLQDGGFVYVVWDGFTFMTEKGSSFDPPQDNVFFLSALASPRLKIDGGATDGSTFECYMSVGPYPTGCM